MHPYFTQKDFVEFQKKLGVRVEAYAPLSGFSFPARKEEYKGLNVLEDKTIQGFANKYGKTPAQIVLNWHLNRDHIVIPNTYKEERLKEDFRFHDFKMDK